MSTIVIDADLQAKLQGFNETMELKTPEGTTIGRFVPEDEYRRFVYARAIECCPYTEEELERFHQEKGGKPLDQIMRELGMQL